MLTLVKFADLSSLLGLEKETLDDYPALKVLVSSVYAAFESYTGRIFELGQYTETPWVSGQLVPLKALPVTAVVSAVTATAQDFSTDNTIHPAGILLPCRINGQIAVDYTGGYEEAPAELTRAALLQIAHEWQRKEQIGATLVSNEGGSTSWPELGLLKEVKRLLDPFVHSARLI